MKRSQFMDIADELIEEESDIIEELIKEEIQPLIDYREQLEKKLFDKAYKEVLELEREE